MTTTVDELTADILDQTGDDTAVLRKLVDRLDEVLAAGALERTVRLWDISNADLGRMFGVSRQAASKWLEDGPPAARRDQVELLGQATDLLDRWVKRERIPAVVRRPVNVLGGRTRFEAALDGQFERLRDELRDTFDLARVAP